MPQIAWPIALRAALGALAAALLFAGRPADAQPPFRYAMEPHPSAPVAPSPLGDSALPPQKNWVDPPPDIAPDFAETIVRERREAWAGCAPCANPHDQPWAWHLLPSSLIYRSYLANPHEPRFASRWNYGPNVGWIWDIALGGRVGIVRYGTPDSVLPPNGWELDLEGAAFPRLDLQEKSDLVATDYRFGIPLSYGAFPWQTKLAFYHLSSHLGDEFMLKNPHVQRINYSRNVIVLGESYYWTPNLRLYAEVGYGYYAEGGSEPWEFQFGADYSPARIGGAPFFAFNGHLREEVDYGGVFVVQWGWQWRGGGAGHLFRIGGEYFNGKSDQFEFLTDSEQKVGIALWYDY